MRRSLTIACALLVMILAGAAQASIGPSSPFRVLWNDKPLHIETGESFSIPITIEVPEGYYLYADDTDIDFASLEGLFVEDIVYPKAEPYEDPFTGRTVDVYRGTATLTVVGQAPEGLSPGQRELTAVLRFRGCSPTLCYRPEQQEIPVSIDVSSGAEPAQEVAAPPRSEKVGVQPVERKREGLRGLLEVKDFSVLMERGTLIAVVIVFLAGLLTSLTPCVWPVIPAVLIFVGVHPHKRFGENLLIALTLVSGLVLTYAILGVAVVAFGKNLGFLYQQKWFLLIVVLFFLAMSLSLMGAFEIRLPAAWTSLVHRLGGQGYRGAFLAGIGLGLIASPCAGPVLAALLGHVALQGSYMSGFGLLVV